MSKKITMILIFLVMFSMISISPAWAETAVTIKVTAGHLPAEEFTTIDLIIPSHQVINFGPLKVGDSVLFTIMDPPDDSLAGTAEGIITKVYDTQDETIRKAIILSHEPLE